MALDRNIAPPISNFGMLQIAEPRLLILDNGIPLYIVDQGEQEVNRLVLLWNGGEAEAKYPSMPVMVASMLREGSQMRSGEDIAELLEFNGAWHKGGSDDHHSYVELYSINSKIDKVFPVLAEMIQNPSFPEHEWSVVKERFARKLELKMNKVEFQAACSDNRLIMGSDHPMARVDTPDLIRNVTTDDLRSWHKRVYSPNSCGIYLAGRITTKIEDKINQLFGTIKSSSSENFGLNVVPFCSRNGYERKHIKVAGAMQNAIRMSLPTIGRENIDYIGLRLLIMALGGYFGSRLMLNIREDKGYTYGIQAHLLGYREGGLISVSTSTDGSYVESVIDEIVGEFNRLKNGYFEEGEMNRLKRYALSQLVSILDSPFSMLDYVMNMRKALTPKDYFDRQQEIIHAITPDDFARLANEYIDLSQLKITVAGN